MTITAITATATRIPISFLIIFILLQYPDGAHDHVVHGIDIRIETVILQRRVAADVSPKLGLDQPARTGDVAIARRNALAGGIADEIVDEGLVAVEQRLRSSMVFTALSASRCRSAYSIV